MMLMMPMIPMIPMMSRFKVDDADKKGKVATSLPQSIPGLLLRGLTDCFEEENFKLHTRVKSCGRLPKTN